jgi:hypothetical protein
LNDGTSGEILVRRELLIRLLDDRSDVVDLVSKSQGVLVTGSLPFLGSLPGGSHSVSHHDLYLNRSAVKPGVSLPTLFEGTPLEVSDLKFNLDARELFGLDSSEHEEVMGVNIDGMALEDMCKHLPIGSPDSNHHVEVSSGNIYVLPPEAMVVRFRSDDAE